MGKQINFFLTERDEVELFNTIEKCGPFEIFVDMSKHRPVPLKRPLPRINSRTGDFSGFCIWPVPRVGKLVVDLIDREYIIDHLECAIMQFSRSQLVNNWTPRYGPKPKLPFIDSGRVWFSKQSLTSSRPYPKEFCEWAECVFRNVHKSLHYDKKRQDYIGAEALLLAKAKKLRLGPP